ncbi:hypothetical protein [Microtetraspora sp. NBRC 13810]|uniref:hypothetical protein n=1 Tax=Microtetraspora sp. NBRC 13810 TaxID=3030990 RepID=UPI002557A27D|nr:hypothetical protein [Microtetraspora sp. NBRC 13810]
MTTAARVPRRRPARRWALLPAAAALGTLFVVPSTQVEHKDDAFISAQTTGILLIEGGECFSDPAYSPVAGEPVVVYTPCADGADNQSYGFVHAADGPWDRASVAAFGWRGCEEMFARRWPGEAASGLGFYPILPTAETWADGDRDIMCAVYEPGGRLSGSLLPLA